MLTGGQTHDCTQAIPLLGNRKPEAVLADKGYDTDPILNHLAERGITAVIAPRSMRKVQRSFDRTLFASATVSKEPSPTSNSSADCFNLKLRDEFQR